MEFDESLIKRRSHTAEGSHLQLMTFHCQQCNTVLGDSSGVCGEITCLDSIVFTRVTNDVVINKETELGHKGEMARCIYSGVKCSGCRCAVGKVIHSAPSRMAAVRSMFLLHKANLSCYILSCSSMVKASTLTLDLKPLGESMNEMRQQLEVQLDQMSSIKSRLDDRSVTSELVQ